MIGMVKYGCGMPFNRLEKLENSLGIPMPSSTQWEVVERAAALLTPAFNELVQQAAQGDLLHNDDTTMRILDIPPMLVEGGKERTGVYTSGIVSVSNGRQIALFFTGHHHAGENLAKVLAHRAEDLGPPIQMCDALSHNTAGDFESIVANCIPHSRRKFVEVVEIFPDECRVVLDAERKVEPNSGLGQAIEYMQKHWEKLTLFLRKPGAPLDNKVCERILKKANLHRKNAYFYKTANGARVGDLFMSLIHTQGHHDDVAHNPGAWMPWNFGESLKRVASPPAPRPT